MDRLQKSSPLAGIPTQLAQRTGEMRQDLLRLLLNGNVGDYEGQVLYFDIGVRF